MKTATCILLSFIGFFNCTGQSKQEKNEMLIDQFFKYMLNDQISEERIITELFSINKLDKDKVNFVTDHLKMVRQSLINMNTQMTDLKVIPFSKAPEESKRVVISDDDKANSYFVYHKEEPPIPILIKNNKIASFSIMDKGTRRYFVEY